MTAQIARNLPCWARCITLLVTVVLVAAPLVAQEEAPPAQEPAGETLAAPRGIPQTALIARSAEADALLARVDELATPNAAIQEIDAALHAETTTLQRKREELDRIEERSVSERTLTDQRERWQRSHLRVLAWRETLQARLQELIELNDDLQSERATWVLTLDDLADSGLGIEVFESLDELVDRIDVSLLRLAPRIEIATELNVRAVRRLEAITDALSEISAMQTQIRARLWVRDSPPIWATPVVGIAVVRGEIAYALSYWWETATDWFGAHYSQVLLLFALFAVLLCGTVTLRRMRHRWAEDPSLTAAVYVLGRPAATAGLAALGASVFLLTPITGPVNDILRLIAVAAVIRLAGGLSAPLPQATYHRALALYLSMVAIAFVPDGSLLGRLLALVMAAAAVAVGIGAIRGWPTGQLPIWRAARVLVGAGVGTAAAGGLASALGWVDLGTTLVTGVISSGFAAFAWMLLINALTSLLGLLHAGSSGATSARAMRRRSELNRAVRLPLVLAACYGWSTALLRGFRADEPFAEIAADVTAASLMVGSLELSVGGVLGAALIVVVTTFIARIVRYVLAEEVFPLLDMRPGTKSTVVSLINYTIIAIGVVMAATAAGFNATQLTVLVGAMSVGIGFGLQAVVGNFVSGLILMFERPVAVGDQVEAGGFLGKITHIGIRASRVQTFDGSDVIIPNSELVTKQVRNWTLTNTVKRINLDLSVGLDSDPRVVIDIMTGAANEHENVLEEPAPRTLMLGYGDSCINFRLQVWIRIEHAIPTPSELHLTLIERLRAVGVEVPAVRRERHQGHAE